MRQWRRYGCCIVHIIWLVDAHAGRGVAGTVPRAKVTKVRCVGCVEVTNDTTDLFPTCYGLGGDFPVYAEVTGNWFNGFWVTVLPSQALLSVQFRPYELYLNGWNIDQTWWRCVPLGARAPKATRKHTFFITAVRVAVCTHYMHTMLFVPPIYVKG